MSHRINQEFWSRAQLSREVLDIVSSLDAAVAERMTQRDQETLESAVHLLDEALEGRQTIAQPVMSPKWALNALKFKSAVDAVAKISNTRANRSDVNDYLEHVKKTLSTFLSKATVQKTELLSARAFFGALQESLTKTFGSTPERPPVKYL